MDNDFFEMQSSGKDIHSWDNRQYTKNVSGILLPDTEVISLHSGWSDMFFYFIDRIKYTIFLNFYDVRQRRQTKVNSHFSSVEFTMMLLNQVSNQLNGLKGVKLMPSFFNITYLPFVDSIVQFEADQVYCTLDIHLKDCFVQELLRDYPQVMEPLMNSIEKKEAKRLFNLHVPATIFMSDIAHSILRNMTKGEKFYPLIDKDVEALIAHAVSYDMDVNLSKLEMHRRDLMNQVYKTIMANPASCPSVKELSEMVHMNQTTLNILYKQQFGLPLKRSWTKFHMDKALYMLAHDRHLQINEIATKLGYEYEANFTKKFKTHFKKTPTQFRKDADDFDPLFQANL